MVSLVCSNRPNLPDLSRNQQWWKRDIFHAAAENGKTLCGRDASEWLAMEARPSDEVLADQHFCQRCAKRVQ